jgi:Ca2+-transporting ATPase
MARSSPLDKYRLVSYLMEAGEVVAVTGDGSNDSAALKKANVGLSMGECGTELAKMASDIIILDDNFNSIVNALKWGRCVYDNIRGFLQFQLTVSVVAMFVAFVGSIKFEESPFKAVQFLWVNMIMNSLAALALATRGPSDALLNRPPYGESDRLINSVLFRNILGHSIYQIAVLLFLLFIPDGMMNIDVTPGDEPMTERSSVVFNTFIFMEVFNLINSRIAGQDMSIFDGLFTNIFFWVIFFVICAMQVIIMDGIPSAFSVISINWKLWLVSLGFGFGSLIIGMFLRFIPVPDNTTQKLEALRKLRQERMKTQYQGMSSEEQWNYHVSDTSESVNEEIMMNQNLYS